MAEYGIELFSGNRGFNLQKSAHVWGTWQGTVDTGEEAYVPASDVRPVPSWGGTAVQGTLYSSSAVRKNHFSVFGIGSHKLWHSCYHLISGDVGRYPGWWSQHAGATVPGLASVYHEESGFLYSDTGDAFFSSPRCVVGAVSDTGNVLNGESGYGVQLGGINITANRRIMRLVASGRTTHLSNGIHSFTFRCATLGFAVYFVPLEAEVPTRQSFVRDAGGGLYEAFFVGASCNVAVYEMKSGTNSESYGIQIFNGEQAIAMESGDRLMIPEQDLHIPPADPGTIYDLGEYSPYRMVNMHCIRYAMRVSPWERQVAVWRDCVFYDRAAGRLRYQLRHAHTFHTNDGVVSAMNWAMPWNSRAKLYTQHIATSVGVIDASTAF